MLSHTDINSLFWVKVLQHLDLDNFPKFEDEQISTLHKAGIFAAHKWDADGLRAICATTRLAPPATAVFLASQILKGFTNLTGAHIINSVIAGAESVLDDNDTD